ncbi:MAG: bifunctional riboflavin kinase/FAD synthetase [Proteobacteria bacterium]|nr:bifunctional riboflavin kinase/FAD synthetase [Pseudomonadota bacterium]
MAVLRGVGGYKGAAPVVTLGNFDGLHVGHCSVLTQLVKRARALKCPSVLYTFDPHPLKVVAPKKSPRLLIDIEDKKGLIAAQSIDCLVLARFTAAFAAKHPREFVQSVIVKGLGAREVWVGRNYSFGKGRAGTVESLRELGIEYGFKVVVINETRRNGAVVSSSRIRTLVESGEVGKAEKLLGRPYSIKGRVVRGQEIGHEVGFPTANISVSSELTPGKGVYAALVSLGAKAYGKERAGETEIDAVVNIGNAPTFGGKAVTVEAHLLGFDKSIYGRRMRVSFLAKLRDERKFGSKEELAAQITRDLKKAKKYFR